MISKELLSNVLGLTVVKLLELDGSILWYKGIVNVNGSPYAKELSVNIYELAHKCKEWALNQKIDNCPKGNPFKYKVLNNLDIVVCKHSIEEGYISNISPLFYSNSASLDIFGINLSLDDTTIISNTIDSLYFYANTEPEAIFKACQWILDKDSK